MAQQYFTLITLLGQAKIAAAIANSASLNISEIAVGDGAYTPTEGQTALISEQYRAAANTVERETDDPSIVRMELVIPSEIGGFIIREFGVFDSDGDLFAIGNLAVTDKPTFDQGSGKEIIIRIRMQISSQANVTLQIDPAVVMASRQYVDTEVAGHKAADPAHPAAKISYDNTTSGLEADDVQAAIDEVSADAGVGLAAHEAADPAHPAAKISYDNTTSGLEADDVQAAIDEMDSNTSTSLATLAAALSDHYHGSAFFIDRKAASTDGGTFTQDAWQVRTLNIKVWDDIGITLSSNQLTVPPGTYDIVWSAPAYRVNDHQSRFYNVTTPEEHLGSADFAYTGSSVQSVSFGRARVVLTENKVFRLEHRCAATASGFGFGRGVTWGNSVFSQLFFRKVL